MRNRMPEVQPSRVAFLKERVEAARQSRDLATFAVPFRQGQIELVKIEVPIDFPLYRLQSGRTHRAQADYSERHALPDNYFDDPESEDAQRAQHEILLQMIDEEGLAEDLHLPAGQRNPLVLTFDGFIVDGNRRTAALRNEGRVENAIAVVLPRDGTASEVYETELELQMARQTKADYNWVDEALHIRYGIQELYSRRSPEDAVHAIATRMNRPDTDVKELLGRLTLVDLYLDWLGQAGKFHRIGADSQSPAEQSFKELYARESAQTMKALPEQQRRTIRQACFTVIRQDGGYQDIRNVANALRTRPADVVERLRDQLPAELSERLDAPPPDDSADSGDGGLLDDLAGAEERGPAPGAELLNVVDEPEHAQHVAPVIMDVAQDIAEEAKESRRHGEPVRKVERALKLLQDVALVPETERLGDIARALHKIAAEVDRLSEDVDRLRSAGS